MKTYFVPFFKLNKLSPWRSGEVFSSIYEASLFLKKIDYVQKRIEMVYLPDEEK